MKWSETVTLGSAVVQPGEKRLVWIDMGAHKFGQRITMPVVVIHGKRPGPVVWIQGGVHGAEKTGTAAIYVLGEEASPDDVSGTLLLAPVINVLAYEMGTRTNFLDGIDLNRTFPGDSRGYFTQQYAAMIWDIVRPLADYIIDVHTGSQDRICPLHVLYRKTANGASEASRKMAILSGTKALWASGEAVLNNSLMHVATNHGIPSIVLEAGPGGDVSLSHLSELKDAMSSVLRGLRLLPGAPRILDEYMALEEWTNLMTREGGLCLPSVQPGEIVNEKQQLATIVNFAGQAVETIRSPFGPAFVRSLVRPYLPVATGDRVAAVLRVVGSLIPSGES